jgi:hypothetical protein
MNETKNEKKKEAYAAVSAIKRIHLELPNNL